MPLNKLSFSRYNVMMEGANPGSPCECYPPARSANPSSRPGMKECLACNVSASAGTRPTSRCSASPARSWPGDRVLVAGTAPVPPGGGPPPPEAYAQAKLCLDLISEALTRAGTSLEHVVRTRMFITDAAHWPEVARAHGEVFADIRPAATAVIVAGLLDPAWLVEIEAEAVLPAL